MSRRGGKKRTTPNYSAQSVSLNRRTYLFYYNLIESMAVSRFKWLNLPNTCDSRFLERTLVRQGIATIAFPQKWVGSFRSLRCVPQGKLNLYDRPTAWIAEGDNGTRFTCNNSTGVVLYDNNTRFPLMEGIALYANELTHLAMARRVNRFHQQIPFIMTGPQERKQDMLRLFRQIADGEPAVIGYDALTQDINYDVLSTNVTFLGEQFAADEKNLWNSIYSMLGINNVTFKLERQIEDEVKAQQSPAELVRLSSLQERRRAADWLNKTFPQYLPNGPIKVIWNQDNISDNFNELHNIKQFMQLGES